MTRIYISDFGDDRNDGLTKKTAIYSWQRAVKLCDGTGKAAGVLSEICSLLPQALPEADFEAYRWPLSC
jgi:hypothetical protein